MIHFEFAISPIVVNAAVLGTIHELALSSPDKDVRLTDDGNGNLKVYVGTLGAEQYRYWVYTDGRLILKEEDANWENAEIHENDWRAVVDDA